MERLFQAADSDYVTKKDAPCYTLPMVRQYQITNANRIRPKDVFRQHLRYLL